MEITHLLSIGAWLVDADGDGLADDLSVGIVLAEGLGPEVWQAAAWLAARLGLETVALNLPVCFSDRQAVDREWRIIVGRQNRQWPQDTDALPSGASPGAGWQLLGRDLLLQGDDGPLAALLRDLAANLPRVGQDGRLPRDWQPDFAAACGNPELPSSKALPPAISCLSQLYSLDGFFVDRDGDCLPDDLRGCLPPAANDLAVCVAQLNFAARLGLETLGMTFRPQVEPARGPAAPISARTAVAEPAQLQLQAGQVQLVARTEVAPAIWDYLASTYPKTPLGSTWSELLLQLEGIVRDRPLGGSWQDVPLTWEVTEAVSHFQQLLRETAGPLTVELRLSEPLAVRQQLRQQLLDLAKTQGLADCLVQVRSAAKQGLQWIREEIIPELLAARLPIDGLLIQVAPFQPGDQPLDPAARWLLELYPADLVLREALSLPESAIRLQLLDGLDCTYRLQALCQGTVCYQREFTVWHSSQPYLPLLGEQPTVHPATGGLAWRAGAAAGQIMIATDLERVFAAYKQRILPELVAQAEQAGGLLTEAQPFFERLHLEVTLSEPEERLGVREELLSPADGLHEDIYFVGLDLFKRLGEANGQQLRSPGLILPEVLVRAGQAPKLRYRLSPGGDRSPIERPTLQTISFDRAGRVTGAGLRWSAADPSSAEQIATALTQQSVAGEAGLRVEVEIVHPGGSCHAVCSLGARTEPAVAASAGVVYADECAARLSRFREQPGALAEVVGVSRQGRPIWGAALSSPTGGRLVSASKLAGWKPTYLLNNRHHANEVSSSSAALDLLEQLPESAVGQALLRRINVVTIPLENVDGAALHQQLAAENPNHKLHAARFNSLGREFADAYFQDDQLVPEARALTTLWRRYVPDIVADNHGIPSHEWDQPFSGYLCPWFSSFWIPRSLFYAYFWHLEDEAHPSRRVAHALEQAISAELAGFTEFQQLNGEHIASWQKYFVPYLTDHFAGEQRNGIIWYYVPSGPDASRRFPSHRYPQLTVLDYTTEVADETAQGPYLALCAEIHRRAQLACLRWLAEVPVELVDTLQLVDGFSYRSRRRRRPIALPRQGLPPGLPEHF